MQASIIKRTGSFKKLFIFFILVSFSLSVYAQNTINISAPQVNQSVWIGNALYTVNKNRDYEKIVLVSALNKMYENNPNLEPSEAIKLLNTAQEKYNTEIKHGLSNESYLMGRTDVDVMNSMYNVASTLPFPLNTAAALGKEAFDWTLKESKEALGPDSRVLGQSQLYNSQNVAQDFQKEQWKKAYELSQKNGKAAQALNTYFGPYLNASSTNSATEVFDKNPDYANNEEVKGIRNMIGPDGKIVTSIDNLSKQTEAQYKNLKTIIEENRSLLKDLNESQKVLVDYVIDQKAKQVLKEKVEKERRIHQLKIEAAGSSIYLLSTFVGFGNPKLGQAISLIGNTTIQIAESISKFTSDAAQLGDPGVSFGSIVFTGNVLGAAMKIFSLFNSGPTTEQIILEQLVELRKQVGELRKEMHERFDRIDHSLNIIYETLNARFDLIDYKLGTLKGNVDEIRQALFNSQAALNRLERNMYSLLNDANRTDLKESINGAIGYKVRTGADLSYNSNNHNFVSYENKFYTWAVDLCKDEVRAGPKQRDYSDSKVYDELKNYPLDANLNYLVNFINIRLANDSILPLANQRLANPRDWAVSTSAYLQLAREWPEYFKRISNDRLTEIEKNGKSIQQTLRNIILTNTRTGLKPNFELFNALISNYKQKAQVLKEKLAAFEINYCENIVQDSKLKTFNKNLDLWGGATQQVQYFPMFQQISPCSQDIPILGAPENIGQLISSTYRLAEQIGLGKTYICASNCSFVDTRAVGPGPGFRRPDVYYSHLSLSIKGAFNANWPNGILVFDHRFRSKNEAYHGNVGARQLTPSEMLSQNWDQGEGYRKNFVSESRNADPNLTNENRTSTERLTVLQIEKQLQNHQHILYTKILTELNNTESDLQFAARELGGAKSLIESFVLLGMPRTIECNDYLHSLLFGNQMLIESEMLRYLYYDALQQEVADSSKNLTRINLAQIIDSRIDALDAELKKILEEIGKGNRIESLRIVDSILEKINIIKNQK